MTKDEEKIIDQPGVTIAQIEVIGYQVELYPGVYGKAIAAVIQPKIEFKTDEAKEELKKLSFDLGKMFADILDTETKNGTH
jgi:hypothetical protein